MTNPAPSPESQINAEGERIAKAALGIPDAARVIPFNLEQTAFTVIAHHSGKVDVFGSLPSAEVISGLRQIADALERGPEPTTSDVADAIAQATASLEDARASLEDGE